MGTPASIQQNASMAPVPLLVTGDLGLALTLKGDRQTLGEGFASDFTPRSVQRRTSDAFRFKAVVQFTTIVIEDESTSGTESMRNFFPSAETSKGRAMA